MATGRAQDVWFAIAIALGTVAVAGVVVFGPLHLGNHDVQRVRMPSESMEPTLNVGDRLALNRDAYDSERPQIGDIVVFHPPKGAERGGDDQCGVTVPDTTPCPKPTPELVDIRFVKRVVAGPGDHLSLLSGHVIRNGKHQKEPFVKECDPGGECNFPTEITIPDDHWYLLGDNRGSSDDSRFWGPVPTRAIVGRVDNCDLLALSCSRR